MAAKAKTQTDHSSQAAAFITSLHESGWHSLNSFADGGHVFELLSSGGKALMVQIYPQGHGFEVWRPITSSSTIAETRVAIEQYAVES